MELVVVDSSSSSSSSDPNLLKSRVQTEREETKETLSLRTWWFGLEQEMRGGWRGATGEVKDLCVNGGGGATAGGVSIQYTRSGEIYEGLSHCKG